MLKRFRGIFPGMKSVTFTSLEFTEITLLKRYGVLGFPVIAIFWTIERVRLALNLPIVTNHNLSRSCLKTVIPLALRIQKSPWTSKVDEVLSKSEFLSGKDYTIADIGTFPWIARHEWHDIGLKKYENLTRWYLEISERDAVKKGFGFMNKDELPPKP